MICECVRPVQGGRFFMASPHGGCTAPPACFEHRVPRFDGVVPQHAPAGLWHRWPRRNPAVGEHRNPLGMHGGCIWSELHHLLLLGAHQPAFTAWLFRWFVGGAVSRQRGGATATEDSSAKHLLPERCPWITMAYLIVAGGPNRTRMSSELLRANRAQKKKLFSVKKRLERSFHGPWLTTNVPPRQLTFAQLDS